MDRLLKVALAGSDDPKGDTCFRESHGGPLGAEAVNLREAPSGWLY
jgi:hypothetical protein